MPLLQLDDPATLERGGGKWLGLTRLRALGATVPPAFCIDADAFRSFALRDELATLVAPLDGADADRIPELARCVRERIAVCSLDPPLEGAIRAGCEALGPVPLAVRSSATAEDRVDASFAGQYDTILDVRGADAVIAALRRCWASVFSDRAIAYRRREGVSCADVAMAVVVQELVVADVSGVAFTRHPVADRPVMLIEACTGLGEGLVSGRVDPDRFEVAREGNAWSPLSAVAGTGLGAAELLAMRDQFLELEAGLGFPADLEWSLREGRLHLLQARPITTRAQGVETSPAAADALHGTGASSGVAEGPARVLQGPDDAELDPGDVLVVSFTDPSWTRHFTVAGALVMEHGGMLSHGAIVARECGIPAVIGIEGATRRIVHGTELRVDGHSGTVTPL